MAKNANGRIIGADKGDEHASGEPLGSPLGDESSSGGTAEPIEGDGGVDPRELGGGGDKRRGRGRPAGSRTRNDGGERKRRWREKHKGSAASRGDARSTFSRPASASNTKDLAGNSKGLEAILLSLHTMVAGITHTPELSLDATEAKKIAEDLANVSKLFPINITEKQLAVSNLCMTLAGVYGTRVIAIRARHIKEAATRPKTAAPFLVKPQPPPQAAEPAVPVNGMPEPPAQKGVPLTPSQVYGPGRAGVTDTGFVE